MPNLMRCFLRSSERAPLPASTVRLMPTAIPTEMQRLRALAGKEVRELLASRAVLLMLLAVGPLVGHAFVTAVRTYSDVSGAAGNTGALSQGISPLDGVLVPTFGAYALVATLLFPFVAIRVVSAEKESGALGLLLQGPTGLARMVAIKVFVLLGTWVLSLLPGLLAVALWRSYGGHVDAGELTVVLIGHVLRGAIVIAIAFAAAAVTESASSAAVLTLGVTLGTWALDFMAQVQGGLAQQLAQFTPDSALRTFEQGELSLAIVLVSLSGAVGLLSAATVWLHRGWAVRRRAAWSLCWLAAAAVVTVAVARVRVSRDVSEDRRNSFDRADELALRTVDGPLVVTAHLAPEDPRLADLQRSVLHKLDRVVPVTLVTVAAGPTGLFEASGAHYGEVWYQWHGQRRMTRSTTVPIVLETIYDLTGVRAPTNRAANAYPGYPLNTTPRLAAQLFYGILPACLLLFAFYRRARV